MPGRDGSCFARPVQRSAMRILLSNDDGYFAPGLEPVAAATEGYLLGIPSLAVSLTSKVGRHFATAAAIVAELLQHHRERPLDKWLLNVNVPDLPLADIKGYRVTRLGRRHKAESVIKT